jgi:hypothetical protein
MPGIVTDQHGPTALLERAARGLSMTYLLVTGRRLREGEPVPRLKRRARLVVAATMIGLSIAWIIWAVNGFSVSDADTYRSAAARLLAGQDLYPPGVDPGNVYHYAPWFAALWIPIRALPDAVGNAAWALALLLAGLAVVLPLARQPNLSGRLTAILGGSVLLWTAARGNVQPLVLLALVNGMDRRSGPLWVALAASLKGVPILFVLVYLARREWWRAAWTVAIAGVLVAPMPLLGWELGTVEPGASLSLYYLASPTVWAVATGIAVLAAILAAWLSPRHALLAAATAAILALPKLLLYDLTYLLVAATPRREELTGLRPGSV